MGLLMIVLFYIWVFVGMTIGTVGLLALEMNGFLVNNKDDSDLQHKVILGIMTFLVLLICVFLGPLPLIFTAFKRNQ